LRTGHSVAIERGMIKAPETVIVTAHRVSCDGASDIPGGAALGHPRVWLEIDEKGFVECGYCDKRFVLKGGPADKE
jgi:uncharacterized Zn-finger protein